jgi:hypothetical protein
MTFSQFPRCLGKRFPMTSSDDPPLGSCRADAAFAQSAWRCVYMCGKCAWKECKAFDTTFQTHQLGILASRPSVPVIKLRFPEVLPQFLTQGVLQLWNLL